ncbi:MAG: GerMN domain-containing protein [Thermoleophilia bacterium]
MTIRRAAAAAFLCVAVLTLAACGSSGGGSPSPTSSLPTSGGSGTPSPGPSASPEPAASPTPGGLSVLSVYFLRGHSVGSAHRAVPATVAPARAALLQLLAGPTAEELAAGLHTQLPPGTRLLGLTIRGGVATVDLNGQFTAGGGQLEDRGRLAQVVYTLTQFPTVNAVRFRIDGRPVVFRGGEGEPLPPQTRRSFEDVTPAIFVEVPTVGDHVGSPLIISGTANTFEAQFFARVRDAAGRSLVNQSIMATSGSGTRGTFNEAITFSTDSARVTLELYESSAADGRPVNVVRIPLRIAAGGVQ